MATPPITPFSKPIDYYEGLLTSEYRAPSPGGSPNMQAWLAGNLQLFQDVIACQQQFLTAFQLSTAIGAQLDVLGIIIGQPRTVSFQPSPVYYITWQALVHSGGGGSGYIVGDIVTVVQAGSIGARLVVSAVSGGVVTTLAPLSYGSGYVSGSNLATTGGTGSGLHVDLIIIAGTDGNPVLDDTIYRTLLQCQVFNNHWDGQIGSLTAFWPTVFPGGTILIEDCNTRGVGTIPVMNGTVVFGGAFTQILLDLIFRGYIAPRPMGVNYTMVSARLPVFGFDVDNTYIAGFDTGYFT